MDPLTESYSGITAGSFGVVALIFGLQFFAEVPKVRKDILQVGSLVLVSSAVYLEVDKGGRQGGSEMARE